MSIPNPGATTVKNTSGTPLSPAEQGWVAIVELVAVKSAERAARLRQSVRHTSANLMQLARALREVSCQRRRLEDARRKRGAARRRSTSTRGRR